MSKHMKTAWKAYGRLLNGQTTTDPVSGGLKIGKETVWGLVFQVRQNLQHAQSSIEVLSPGTPKDTIDTALTTAALGGNIAPLRALPRPAQNFG